MNVETYSSRGSAACAGLSSVAMAVRTFSVGVCQVPLATSFAKSAAACFASYVAIASASCARRNVAQSAGVCSPLAA